MRHTTQLIVQRQPLYPVMGCDKTSIKNDFLGGLAEQEVKRPARRRELRSMFWEKNQVETPMKMSLTRDNLVPIKRTEKIIGNDCNRERKDGAMNFVQYFLVWWNRQAAKNGKTKFRNQKEAAEFIRQVQNRTGGPNAKLIAMRERYVEANAGKRGQNATAGSVRG